jgi:hypothetical protein
MRPGDVVVTDTDDTPLTPAPITPTTYTFVDVPTRILTNGSETVALMIPTNGGDGLKPLADGSYSFEFSIDRARFRSQTPDDISNYRARCFGDRMVIH